MTTIGFIGLGVMGEPMCRNLARKGGWKVVAFDVRPEPLARVATHGAHAAESARAVVEAADIVLLSLPGGPQVRALCLGPDGILAHARAGQIVADTSTCPVALARELDAAFAAKGVRFADTPIAKTRQAAEQGTLSIMVGAAPKLFAQLQPVLATMGSEVTHCGPVGSGQLVKLMNNMVIAQTVVALSEAITIARRAGMDDELLFETMTKGSSDSFALRNHGMKTMRSRQFPLQAFSTRYAIKDLSYALDMAAASGFDAEGAKLTMRRLQASEQQGHADEYFPAMQQVIDPETE